MLVALDLVEFDGVKVGIQFAIFGLFSLSNYYFIVVSNVIWDSGLWIHLIYIMDSTQLRTQNVENIRERYKNASYSLKDLT